MPPKRKAPASKNAGKAKVAKTSGKATKAKGKKSLKNDEEEETGTIAAENVKDAVAKLKSADVGRTKKFKVDSHCHLANAEVHDVYDCMLNQTNIGQNNNKFYVIQVLKKGGKFYHWNRWGRVGEAGQSNLAGPTNEDAAINGFKKKFKDKTRNAWDNRDNFKAVPKKYTLIEMEGGDDDEEEMDEKKRKLDELDGTRVKKTVLPSELDKPTQDLMRLIFDNDMFSEAMKSYDIDVKKMPLGKLSKTQIAKGFEILEDIEEAVEKKKMRPSLAELSSKFYTTIPHDFGRTKPPVINSLETVRQKMDMLLVLGDIELAQAMQKDKKKSPEDEETEVVNPLDQNYDLLDCDLEHLAPSSKEFKILATNLSKTGGGGYYKLNILDIWKVNRRSENKRFASFDHLDNRKLLWHGTNVAVVAAILSGGLRIMPHSGGRVGKGIYFASENKKSAGYVRRAPGDIGIMFMNEVALGEEHHITKDDWRLVKPPPKYHSVVARGRTEPDPKFDISLPIDGKPVKVAQGQAVAQPKFSDSNFSESEYLIYNEGQCRIRYMFKLKFTPTTKFGF